MSRKTAREVAMKLAFAKMFDGEGEETYQDVPEFCYSAHFDEVAEKGFTLVPSRYIEFINRDENIDYDAKMKALQSELQELLAAEKKSEEELLAVFKELGYEIRV